MQYYSEHEYDCLGNYDPIIPPCKVCNADATRSINWIIDPEKSLRRKFEYYCDKHAPKEAAKF
jgi:hypothetical protein